MAFTDGLNRFTGMGRIYPAFKAEEFQLQTTGTGKNFVKATIAIPRPAPTTKEQNDQKTQYDYIPAIAWGGLAKFISTYLNKSQRVFVEGSIQTSSWKDKEGKYKNSVDLIIGRINAFDKTAFGEDNRKQYVAPNPAADQFAAEVDESKFEISPDDLPF